MPVSGQRVVINNLIRFSDGFVKHANATMKKAVKVVDKQVTKNMSRKDFSLSELTFLNHPFASKHGSKGTPVYDPYWMIHKRSGDLLGSKFTRISGGVGIGSLRGTGKLDIVGEIGLDKSKTAYAQNIVFGTSKMIPRPILTGSLSQKEDQVRELFDKNLRSAVINFR